MAIIVRSGVTALVESVKAYFVENGVTANVVIGWKARTRQDNEGPGGANRVCFTPSDPTGKGGRIEPPLQTGDRDLRSGSNPVEARMRALSDWGRVLNVSVWQWDGSAPEDEGLALEAVETLQTWVMNAVHAYAFTSAEWGDTTWTPVTELSYGLELRMALTFRHPIYQPPRGVVYPTGFVERANA